MKIVEIELEVGLMTLRPKKKKVDKSRSDCSRSVRLEQIRFDAVEKVEKALATYSTVLKDMVLPSPRTTYTFISSRS